MTAAGRTAGMSCVCPRWKADVGDFAAIARAWPLVHIALSRTPHTFRDRFGAQWQGKTIVLYLVAIDCGDERLPTLERVLDGLTSDIFSVRDRVWVIEAESPAVELRNRIKPNLQNCESALIALLAGHAAWAGYDPEATDWLLKN